MTLHNADFTVDILHLSPPCQAFSIANTTPNAAKDKLNIAASMTIGGVLSLAKPRVVTLEQAHGIIRHTKHQKHFDEVLRQFTQLGFSVRWRFLKFIEYGLPQERSRLIVIASRKVVTLVFLLRTNKLLQSWGTSPVIPFPHSRH